MKWIFKIFLLWLVVNGYSQDREAAIWHFGQFAGLDFNTLTPQSINQGRLNTVTGCSAISDDNGLLQLYSDGLEAFSGSHELISQGIEMLGDTYSTQSALIVPRPGSKDGYFIFTVDELRQANRVLAEGDGLNYYSASLSGSGGSIARVPSHLITYDPEERTRRLLKCSEKLTAIKHPDEDKYWLITHFEDTFYAFSIDVRGVNAAPVKSRTGPYQFLAGFANNMKGQLKMSPDGTKLAMANYNNNVDSEGFSPGSLYLFDFDIDTGIVSNPVQLLEDDKVFAYGVEFSPNSKMIYASVSSFRNGDIPVCEPPFCGPLKSSLFQIDLTDDLKATRLYGDDKLPTGLQLAIDGKIYRAREGLRQLGVIENPNAGAQDVIYNDDGLGISRASGRTLPGFVQSYFQVRIEYEEACQGFETILSTNYLPDPDNISWDFGDGSPVLNTTDKNITHLYSNAGVYQVRATFFRGDAIETYTRSVVVRTLPVVRPATITQCDEDGDGIANFNLYEPSERINPDPEMRYKFYFSQADAENNTNEIPRNEVGSFSNTLATRVFTRATSPFGCFSITHIDLEVSNNALPPDLMLYYSACDNEGSGTNDTNGIALFDFSAVSNEILALFPDSDGLVVNYYRTYEQALAEINEIDPTKFINVTSPFEQKIWVRVEGAASNTCIGLGQHLTLVVEEVPSFELAEAEVLCQKQYPYSMGIKNPAAQYSYNWTDSEGNSISTSADFTAMGAGVYTVTATQTDGTGCAKSKQVELTTIAPPVITDVDVDGIITLRSSATVITEESEGFEYALDNDSGPYQDSNVFYEVAPGLHQAFVRDKNNCELVSMEFSVIGHPAFFTPNSDGINDYWQLQGVNEVFQSSSLIHIYDRYGVLLAQVDPTSVGWDGMQEGRLLPASDYWFRVQLEDGREFSGHFTLKR